MKTLTEKQKNIIDFIEEFIDREGMAPTVYEIADHFNIKTSTVFAHLRALQRKKQLTRSSKARSIALAGHHRKPGGSFSFAVPLLGRINAGTPSESLAYKEGEVYFGPALPNNCTMEQLFALRVQGESMRDIGIYDGDVVIVQAGAKLRPGDIVVALLQGGEMTVKSYFPKMGGRIELRPANAQFSLQNYAESDVTIQGKVIALQRNY